jgi:hypothetical protein
MVRASSPPQRKLFLTIQPLNAFVIHPKALAADYLVQTSDNPGAAAPRPAFLAAAAIPDCNLVLAFGPSCAA